MLNNIYTIHQYTRPIIVTPLSVSPPSVALNVQLKLMVDS